MLGRVSVAARRAGSRGLSGAAGEEVVIASAVRTPVGSIMGSLSSIKGPQLGALAVRAAVERAGVDPAAVNEVFMGNVVSAGEGQAPARQAALFGGLPVSVPCTQVNKVCASGMKAVMLGAQTIMAGQNEVVVAGGFESMSNAPFLLPRMRGGAGFGHTVAEDSLLKDGLWDVYNDFAMGHCGDRTAREYGFSREDQDSYAIQSYKRAQAAWAEGRFAAEVVPVEVAGRKGKVTVVDTDEEPGKALFDKIPQLKPAFSKDGTVTAANAPSINDGASALVITSASKAAALGLKPLAKIRGFGDAAHEAIDFPTAPAKAVPIAAARAGVDVSDIDYHEINEAFSVVSLVNQQILGLDGDRVNVNGGAVAMGHPIGSSGSRIIVTLLHVLQQRDAALGCASICNGGGGASAIIIERL